jgi:hypothetical protein
MNARSIMFGIGVLAMLVAVMIQLGTDSTTNAHVRAVVSIQPTSVRNQFAAVKPAAANTGLFFVRPERRVGELILYDAATARPRIKLPAEGKLSADQEHYFFVRPDGLQDTVVEGFNVETADVTRHIGLPGQWVVSGVSNTGRWLALERKAEDRGASGAQGEQTHIEILDTSDDAVAHKVDLDGNFDVDAISSDGESLFLIQHLAAMNNDRYEIRLYDLETESLRPDALREKGADEVMVGRAYQQLATPDGTTLLTLYLDTTRGVAFIHDLDMVDKYPVCIDLPSAGGNLEALRTYSLALSPDGKEVYAVNVAIGLVAEVSLDVHAVAQTFGLGAYAPSTGGADQTGEGANPTVVSKDGKRLFFADKNEIWAFDTAAGNVSDSYQLATDLYGLGVNDAGTRLYAVTGAESARVFTIPINGTFVPLE